jgi:hypothetical protein
MARLSHGWLAIEEIVFPSKADHILFIWRSERVAVLGQADRPPENFATIATPVKALARLDEKEPQESEKNRS